MYFSILNYNIFIIQIIAFFRYVLIKSHFIKEKKGSAIDVRLNLEKRKRDKFDKKFFN